MANRSQPLPGEKSPRKPRGDKLPDASSAVKQARNDDVRARRDKESFTATAKPQAKRHSKPRAKVSVRAAKSSKSRRTPANEAEGALPRSSYGRMQILRGAAAAFGELGFAATRVEDILAAAGVSRPTFYRFFRNKEDVFDALDELSHMSLVQLVTAAVDGASEPFAKLERAVEAFLRWQVAAGPVARVLREEAGRPDSVFAERRRISMGILFELLDRSLAAIGGAAVDPMVMQALIAALERIADALHEGGRIDDEAIARGRRVALRIFYGTLAEDSAQVPPLPRLSDLSRRDRRRIERRRKTAAKRPHDAAGLWPLDREE